MNAAGPSAMRNQTLGGLPSPTLDYESAFCQGCRNPIDSDPLHGGVVVQFESSLWHTTCFRCAKCGDQLSAQSTLVLLSDGFPVCSKCTYVCNVCKLEIKDEAIMTGEDAYHASCFTCRTCHKRIEELVFAKTSQGIYCMDCHNERVARSRRRAEHKQSKGRSRRTKDGDHSRDPKSTPRPLTDSGNELPHNRLSGDKSFVNQSSSSLATTPTRSNSKQAVPQDVDATFVSELGEINDAVVQQVPIHDGMPPGSTLVLSPDDDDNAFGTLQDEPESQPIPEVRGTSPRQATYPVVVLPAPGEDKRSKSYDDGTRPLHKLFGNGKGPTTMSDASITSPWYAGGLDIPGRVTTKAERRISMNPPPRTSLGDDSPDDPRGRRVSSGSETSAYYSPKSLELGRASPSGNQLEVNRAPPSRPRSPSVSHRRPTEEAPVAKASDSAASSSSFPPRGQSLRKLRAPEAPGNVSATSPTSSIRSKLAPEPSVSVEPASDDEAEPTIVLPPPPGEGLPSRPSTPTPATNTISVPSTPPAVPPSAVSSQPEEELTPVQPRRVAPPPLVPPALPPIRLSMHGADFADLLKTVADGSPKVPMRRDSQLRVSTDGTSKEQRFGDRNRDIPSDVDEDDEPVSPSVLGRERIAASQTDHGESGSEEMSPKSTITTQARLSHSPETAASSPTVPIPSLSAPVVLPSTAPRGRSGSMPPHTDAVQKAPSTAVVTLVPPGSMEQRDSERTSSAALADGHEAAEDRLRPLPRRVDAATELMSRRLREALADAKARGAASLKFDPHFAEALLRSLESSKEAYSGLKTDLDNVKRTSHQYMKGFSVAQEEYQKEVAHRKDVEAEVTRLRVQLAGQAARLVALTAQDRTQSQLEKLAVETTSRLQGLERELAKLKVERDMALAEIEEINLIKKAAGGSGNEAIANVSRALSSRLDYTKAQYRRELEPLEEKRERLLHDIAELREARAIFVEETTALNTRNEQLAELNAQIALQIQAAAADGTSVGVPDLGQLAQGLGALSHDSPSQSDAFSKAPAASARGRKADLRGRYSPSMASSATLNTLTSGNQEGLDEFGAKGSRIPKPETAEPVHQKKFKWFGPGHKHGGASTSDKPPPIIVERPNGHQVEKMHGHNFVSANMLRIGRCDQCGDKLWGASLRCANCHFACHSRCGVFVKGICRQTGAPDELAGEITPMPPSMFGRDLIEQVRADDVVGTGRTIPVIVEKCLEAVEASGLDYEGIYRKTGGASESKAITQMFERGNYSHIDLLDGESFHDVSSVTSVLKNYFRGLPNPLFTFEYYESFVASAALKDPADKITTLKTLCKSLPLEHYCTLRALMLHLHRVERHKDVNLMNARNLGVVFGPTLMRSSDPGQEFADMAGKAQTVEWLVNHAQTIFKDTEPFPVS